MAALFSIAVVRCLCETAENVLRADGALCGNVEIMLETVDVGECGAEKSSKCGWGSNSCCGIRHDGGGHEEHEVGSRGKKETHAREAQPAPCCVTSRHIRVTRALISSRDDGPDFRGNRTFHSNITCVGRRATARRFTDGDRHHDVPDAPRVSQQPAHVSSGIRLPALPCLVPGGTVALC